MIEYRMEYEEGSPVACVSCQYVTHVSGFGWPAHLSARVEEGSTCWLCQFCATTRVGNTYLYESQHEDGAAAQAVAHAFNALVDGLGIDRSKMWRRDGQ